MRSIRISRASAGFITRAHPWLRPDRFTQAPVDLQVGECVELRDERGQVLATALADPGAAILARVCGPPGQPFDAVTATLAAWSRRAPLHAQALLATGTRESAATDCYRVVHGEADGLPGLRVERLGGVLVLCAFARCMLPHLDAISTTLAQVMPEAVLVEKLHMTDLRVGEIATRRRDGAACQAEHEVPASELGCRLAVRPFGGLATGIYVDQRATRRWLRANCGGASILNLFAYTGLFSTSLLSAGAAEADDVDLSAPALSWGGRLAALNEVANRRRAHRVDARTFLERADRDWDLIICDPPTAAQGGGSWVARRDYPSLLAAAARHLAPSGLLLASTNTLGRPLPLRNWLADIPQLQLVEGPGLAEDLPQMHGFPEGRPYRLVVARRQAGGY